MASAASAPRGPAAAAPAAERIEQLDALRGLALFGILLANILYWSGWILMPAEARTVLAGAEAAERQHFLHLLLVDGKFYTLFSLLFGVGFALQLARLERRGADGVAIFRRRLLVLLAIGLVHLVLIWDGDILTLYALLGLTLPLFRDWSGRQLLAVAAVLLFAVPIAGQALFEAAGWAPHRAFSAFGDRIFVALGGTPGNEIAWLQREDWGAYWSWVLSGWPYRPSTLIESWRVPKVLGIMMIGLWAGRRLADGRLVGDRTLLWRVFGAGLAIGLPFSYLYASGSGLGQASIPSILGTAPLALAYGAGFLLLWPKLGGTIRLLTAPGRMALTNYLMQSLLGILLFYGVGFGLIGRLVPAQFYAVAVAVFATQILLSHLWLARFQQGPMERLWRLGTYGRRR